jgi:hypothetical protein
MSSFFSRAIGFVALRLNIQARNDNKKMGSGISSEQFSSVKDKYEEPKVGRGNVIASEKGQRCAPSMGGRDSIRLRAKCIATLDIQSSSANPTSRVCSRQGLRIVASFVLLISF